VPTEIYQVHNITTISGEEIEIIPLKIKYLKEFMPKFREMKDVRDDLSALTQLTECVRIAMKQYKPEWSKSIEFVEENFDMPLIYKFLEYSVGIKIKNEEEAIERAEEGGNAWDELDLAQLESEVFLLGIWKNYDELETSISMQELTFILETKRDVSYDEKKFFAALQGVDLDGQSGKGGQKEWEDLKARVASGGATSDSRDILALQGQNARSAGFGIGMGLQYEKIVE
jgi:hypothetical protein